MFFLENKKIPKISFIILKYKYKNMQHFHLFLLFNIHITIFQIKTILKISLNIKY